VIATSQNKKNSEGGQDEMSAWWTRYSPHLTSGELQNDVTTSLLSLKEELDQLQAASLDATKEPKIKQRQVVYMVFVLSSSWFFSWFLKYTNQREMLCA